MDTLDQMKAQLQLLHNLLDGQPIVSDRLIRAAIHRKMNAITRQALLLSAVSVVGIPYCLWAFHTLGLSWPLGIVTILFLIISLAYRLWAHSGVRAHRFATEPLRQVAARVARMKQRYARWLYFSVPFLIVWMSWLAYELLYRVSIPEEERLAVLCGALTGGLVGAILGIIAYRRTQRLARAILDQICDNDSAPQDAAPAPATPESDPAAAAPAASGAAIHPQNRAETKK